MPHICSFKYSYPLIVMFSSIHTLGTMCDSSLGVCDVQILILASARIVCNIVYVQVRDCIHRELCCKN
jgi:hypothetical protein